MNWQIASILLALEDVVRNILEWLKEFAVHILGILLDPNSLAHQAVGPITCFAIVLWVAYAIKRR